MEKYNFDCFLMVMAIIAVIVFIALYFVKAGYGIFFDRKWGIALNNKIFKHHYNDFKMKNSHIFYLLINKIFTVH